MITLSVNSDFLEDRGVFRQSYLSFLEGSDLGIDSAYLLHNNGKADIVDGEFEHVYGSMTITESLTVDGVKKVFEIAPRSFFQTNTYGAEKLYDITRSMIRHPGGTILDLYAGTGTIGIMISDLAERVHSVELVESSSQNNLTNLTLNSIDNVEVVNAKVEDFLRDFQKSNSTPSTIIIDPPRAGMHPSAPGLIPQF